MVTLREPGGVLLVACYELGHQPLSLASPLALLQVDGFAPAAVDTSIEPLPEDAVRRARLVAVSVPMHTALRLGVEVARSVRRLNPAAHLCAYGLYATLNADYLLGEGLFDSVIGGEFEAPLLELARTLDRASADAPAESEPDVESPAAGSDAIAPPGRAIDLRVPGVGTRDAPAAPALQKVPFRLPAREALLPLRRYAHLLHNGRSVPAGYVEASRGCLHTCRHCPVVPIYRGRFFVVPREIVLEDIRRQVAAGAGHITFGDPDFLNGPGHVMRIVRAMHDEFPDLTFDATIKIEHIIEQRALFPELARLGCLFVVSALESVSDRVLERLEKGHTRADIETALGILGDAGIAMRPSLLPFTPWTTLEDYAELLEFCERHELLDHIDPVHLSIRLLVPPGSALLDEPETATLLGPLDAPGFTYTWSHPDSRVDRLQAEVAALVEAAERTETDPVVTFHRIKALAWAALGRPTPPEPPPPPPDRRRPPRLTESWFC